MKIKIILLIIIILGFIARIYQINQYPPALNWDEVSLGYNAYSIGHTLKDEWGNFLPTIFQAYGDYKLPVYVYLSVPFILIFGLNTLGIKLLSIISGTLLIFITYKILFLIIKSKNTSLLGSFLIALSPWSIFLSRIALEANLFLLLFSISFYYLLKNNLAISSLFFGISLFTYNSSRVLLPFYLLVLLFLFIKSKIKFNYSFLPFLIFLFLFIFQTFSTAGQARYKWVSLLDQGAINQINELQPKYSRLVVNKATFFVFTAVKNYFSHFDYHFLFVNGGSHYQFNLQHFYLLSPLLIPLFFLGLFYLLKNKQLTSLLLLFFFFVSPLPSAITRDAPHTLRSILFIYLSSLIVALGSYYLKKTWLFFPCILVIIYSNLSFWGKYQLYSSEYILSWQYGYQPMVEEIKKSYSYVDQVYITKKYGEPHEFILFYWPIKPQNYQPVWDYHDNWFWVNRFDKFIFYNDYEFNQTSFLKNSLIITSPGDRPIDSKLIKTIYTPNNQPVFDIFKYE